MRIFIASLCLLLGANVFCAAAENVPQVSSYFYGKKSGTTASGKTFTYEWRFKRYDGRKPAKWVGGDSLDPPRFVVEEVKVELGGKAVAIPSSAYSDIYDPGVQSYGPYVMEDKAGVYLVIDASDGAGAAQIWLREYGVGVNFQTQDEQEQNNDSDRVPLWFS